MSSHETAITLFTAPKPFRGPVAEAQERAIQSWMRLGPGCDVCLIGDEYGIPEMAARYGVRHRPHVERNQYGTPLISSIFHLAQETSGAPVLCYLNADIILMSDFLPAVAAIPFSQFLMVGRRWNIDPQYVPELSTPDWELRLHAQIAAHGRLFAPSAIDYFVFTRGLWPAIPPFAVGRATWDNWMIYNARVRRLPVIDATAAVTAVHQNHDYSHHPAGVKGVWTGPEATLNRKLAGGPRRAFTIEDANYRLVTDNSKLAIIGATASQRAYSALSHWPGVGLALSRIRDLSLLPSGQRHP